MVINSDGHVPFRWVTLGLEAPRQILAANPAANVIILSAQTDDVYLESLTTVGAGGIWEKQTAAGILAAARRTCSRDVSSFARPSSRAWLRIARLEIDSLCGACVHRCVEAKCRHLSDSA